MDQIPQKLSQMQTHLWLYAHTATQWVRGFITFLKGKKTKKGQSASLAESDKVFKGTEDNRILLDNNITQQEQPECSSEESLRVLFPEKWVKM